MSTFQCPPEHREGFDAVKRAVGIGHGYLDGWIYLFYENKKFDVQETIAKLQRRDTMEREVFINYDMTPSLRESMRAGIVQYIGRDKMGRPVLFFNTVRDHPTADQRPERQANLDMFLSWAVRCDPVNPTATVTWLINQQDASLMRNTDLIFQKDMALRISKFFPGVVAKMYICNMGSALTFVMKPLLKQLPAAISDCIYLFSSGDIRRGKLLEVIDADVLPIAMGGNNDIDHPQNYELFATSIEGYFERCQRALRAGISIKEMEMMEAYPVDKNGKPRPVAAAPAPAPATGPVEDRKAVDDAEDETLDHASPVARSPSRIRVDRGGKEAIIISTSAVRRERVSSAETAAGDDAVATSADGKLWKQMTFFHTQSQANLQELRGERELDEQGLPKHRLDCIEVFSYARNLQVMRLPEEVEWKLQRDWAQFLCHCVTLVPPLRLLMEALRDDDLVTDEILHLHENIPMLRRVVHDMLDLFPQTSQPLHYPVFQWLTTGLSRKHNAVADDVTDRVAMDCTSPDNFLLSVQGTSVEFVDECERLLDEDNIKARILRRLVLSWPTNAPRSSVISGLRAKADGHWRQVVPLFHKYIEAKVAMSIGEFIDRHGLLAAGGRIDTRAAWYSTLFTSLVQYRELHRRNWLFYVFPPLFRRGAGDGSGSGAASADAPAAAPAAAAAAGGGVGEVAVNDTAPDMAEMLRVQGYRGNLSAVSELLIRVERSVAGTREQLTPASAAKIASHTVVERYMEETGAKIYIPYEAQLSGSRPQELVAAEKERARQVLEAAEQPLRELLSLQALLFVLEHGIDGNGVSDGGDAARSRETLVRRANAVRRQCQYTTNSRRSSRRAAVAIAKAAYEVQGTFGDDWIGLLPVYGGGSSSPRVVPDGYALALDLLLVEALVEDRMPRESAPNESFAMPRDYQAPPGSPTTDPLLGDDGDMTEEDDLHSAYSAERVDVGDFLETVRTIDAVSTLLTSTKRQLIS